MGLNLQFHSLQRDASDTPGALGTDGIHKEFEMCEVLLVNLLTPVKRGSTCLGEKEDEVILHKIGVNAAEGRSDCPASHLRLW